MANRIKELRKERKLTVAALAELVGLSSRQITYLENGERELTIKTMKRIAAALDVKVSDIVTDDAFSETHDAIELKQMIEICIQQARNFPEIPLPLISYVVATVFEEAKRGKYTEATGDEYKTVIGGEIAKLLKYEASKPLN